jgi:hypothetical protein
MLAQMHSRNVQDHSSTALWPLSSTVPILEEASVQSGLVCINVVAFIFFSFNWIYTVHDLSIQPTRVEGCLQNYCIRLN